MYDFYISYNVRKNPSVINADRARIFRFPFSRTATVIKVFLQLNGVSIKSHLPSSGDVRPIFRGTE